jgi:hypothetical protein
MTTRRRIIDGRVVQVNKHAIVVKCDEGTVGCDNAADMWSRGETDMRCAHSRCSSKLSVLRNRYNIGDAVMINGEGTGDGKSCMRARAVCLTREVIEEVGTVEEVADGHGRVKIARGKVGSRICKFKND